jgi:hypothetical protein
LGPDVPDAGRASNNDNTVKREPSFGRAQWNRGQERRPSLQWSLVAKLIAQMSGQ